MSYDDYCASCTYLEEQVDYEGKYRCEKKYERVYASDPKCYRYCEAYRRSDSARENMYENSNSHNSSGCYITTIMCSVLGYDDSNYYLNTLRKFRDGYMKENNKSDLLLYDIIGPMIVKSIENDPNKEGIAYYYFNNYIIKAVLAIEENKYEEAIRIYKQMTEKLTQRFGISGDIIYPELDKIDNNYLGHGKVRKLIPNQN